MYLSRFIVHRLPGISQGFSISPRPGLNLLTGPNGCGKSSTARALTSILWPSRSPGPGQIDVQAHFQSGQRELIAATTATSVVWTENGATVPAPDLPATHLAACYHLDILDIINPAMAQDDAQLARNLAKELSGGIDKGRLREQLFSLSGLAAGRKSTALQEARKAVTKIEQQHSALAAQQTTLGDLQQEVAQATRARGRAEILSAINTRAQLQLQCQQSEAALQKLPQGAGQVRREDPDRLRHLRKDLAEKNDRRDQTKLQLKALRQQQEAITPPPEPGAASALAELSERIEDLATAETQFQEAERARAQHYATQQRASGQEDLDTVAQVPLDRAAINSLMAAWSAYQDCEIRSQGLRKILGSPAPAKKKPTQSAWLGGGCGLLGGAVLGLVQHTDPLYYEVLGGLGLLVLVYAWFRLRQTRTTSANPLAEELATLEAQLVKAKTTLDQRLHHADLELDLADPSRLLLLERIRAHGENQEELARMQDRVVVAQERRDQALEPINTLLSSWHRDPASDLSSARAALVGLKETWQQLDHLGEKIASFELANENLNREIDHLEREVALVLQAFQLEGDADPVRTLEYLLEAQPGYQKLTTEISTLGQNIAAQETIIQSQGDLFPEGDPAQRSPREIQALLEQEEKLIANSHQVSKKIGALETQIKMATESHSLENALAVADQARDHLQAAFARELEVELGNLLLDQVMAEYQTATRPAALTAANEILNSITNQPYKLTSSIAENGDPLLLVHDRFTDQNLVPSQLSTGTRTQLFLALRLGFLSTQTVTHQPPVILDDVLTTSDPVRFVAAVTSLGRLAQKFDLQIFYLCSRPDEVAAWQQTLAHNDLPAAYIIDLAARRGKGAAISTEVMATWDSHPGPNLLPPAPGDKTAPEYALILQVPQPRTWDSPGNLHLFFLLADDLDLLHEFLEAGVEKVGHWQGHGHGLTESRIISKTQGHHLDILIKIWERYLELWRQGRPPQVTAQNLSHCQAVTAGKLPEVQAYLQEVDGRGQDLILGLRQGKVPRFQSAKTDQLENELIALGCIDSVPPLAPDEITRELFFQFAGEFQAGTVKKQAVPPLVDRLSKTLAHA